VYLKDGTVGDSGDFIVKTSDFTSNLTTAKDNTGLVASSSHIDATNLFGSTTASKAGFIKNYLYPAFHF